MIPDCGHLLIGERPETGTRPAARRRRPTSASSLRRPPTSPRAAAPRLRHAAPSRGSARTAPPDGSRR
jgi:hypothetical protein